MATNSFLGSNSFIAPKQVSAPTSYTKMDPRALGTLQPLVSDLIQTTAPKNKYLKETYSADPQALQNRLNEYKFYDPVQLEGLKDYFSPYAATTYKNSLVFKPSEFESAQSKLFGLDSSQTQALSGALQAYKPIGTLGGSNYYSKDDIGKALSGYGAIDTEKWGGYSDSTRSKFSPVTTIGNQVLIRPEDTGPLRTVLGVEDYLGKINPLRTKQETWAPDPALVAKRKWWDSTPLRPDPSLGYREIHGGVDENGVASDSIWVRGVADPLSYDQFWSEYGSTPEGGWHDANTKRSWKMFGNTKPILQRWQDDASYLPNFSLYGSGSPEDIQRGFNVLQRMSPQNIGEFWGLSPAAQKGMLENPGVALQQMQSLANPANGDWLSIGAEGGFNSINAYNWDKQRGLTADPSQYMNIHDEGPFGDNFITDILDNKYVNTALSFIPATAPYMAAYNAVNAIHNDDPVGVILSALNASGLNPASVIGEGANTALNLGLGKAGQMALGGSLYGAGMGALRGGGLQGALTGALTGGLGGYAGNYMSGLTNGMSPLTKMAAQIAYGSGVGGLSSAIQGKGFSRGASNAARRGVTNAAINAALNSQLYKGLV